MRDTLFLFVLALCIPLTSSAQNNSEEYKVLKLSNTIWVAMQNVDVEILTKNIAPEAVFVHMGATFTRDKEIEVLQQKIIIAKEVENQETSVRIVGKTAVLLRKIRLTAIVNGNEVVNPFVVTESYTHQKGGWQLLALTYTRINY